MNSRFLVAAIISLLVQMSYSQVSNEVIHDNNSTITFKSEILQSDMQVLICLPADYDSNSENYGVHYVIGGENRFAYYVGAYHYFSLQGEFPKSIIVRAIPNPGFKNSFQELEKADKFVDYLQYELIPYIDEAYRTNSFRSLWGQSNSGAFTFYNFLTNPDLFTAYFMSAPYGLQNINKSDVESIDENLQHSKYLYMSFGTEDVEGQLAQFSAFKETIGTGQFRNLVFGFDLLDAEDHQSIVLRNIPDALQSFYSSLKYEINDYKRFQLDSLKSHYLKLSNKYGYEMKIPEEGLNRLAFDMFRRNYYDNAESLLLYCIEIYPETRSAKYNLLGGVYENRNDIPKAIQYYKKDLEIYPENEWTKNKLKALLSNE